jgi:hypothetical protein
MTGTNASESFAEVADAFANLGKSQPELATALARVVKAIIDEAGRTPRFANSLTAALNGASPSPRAASPAPIKRTSSRRRARGVIDPFAVYTEIGDGGLRDRLGILDLEQLRDIIAEHGMDHDRLAMKWKTKDRVINRIVDKVAARTAKGSAFRTESD